MLFCLLCFSPASADAAGDSANCVQPNADGLLGQAGARAELKVDGPHLPGAKARYMPFTRAGKTLQWMGTSWDAPPDGVLFVLDCTGNIIAAKQIGAVSRLSMGPKLALGETAEVIYQPGDATGEHMTLVGIVRFNGTRIELLWEHLATHVVALAILDADFEESFHWQVSPDGTRIRVTGRRQVGEIKDPEYGWPPHSEHALPSKSFCLSASKRRYLRCR